MAFGTGHHGTTFGILAEMVQMNGRAQKSWTWAVALAFGHLCGPEGCAQVMAIDIDPWSVRNTRENLR